MQYLWDEKRLAFDISEKAYQDVTEFANVQLLALQVDAFNVFFLTFKFFRFFTLNRKMYAVFVTMQRVSSTGNFLYHLIF